MSEISIPFTGRLEAYLDNRVMRNASIMRFGSVKERLKTILANLEPENRVYNVLYIAQMVPGHQALPILHHYFDLHQDTSSPETVIQPTLSRES